MAWRCRLTFHWAVAVGGAIHESDVHVRADNAAERGVPLPEGWQIVLPLNVFAHMQFSVLGKSYICPTLRSSIADFSFTSVHTSSRA